MSVETRILLDVFLAICIWQGVFRAWVASRPAAKERFGIRVTTPGTQKIHVIKAIREATGMGLKEAKEAAEGLRPIAEGLTRDEVVRIGRALNAAGATILVEDA